MMAKIRPKPCVPMPIHPPTHCHYLQDGDFHGDSRELKLLERSCSMRAAKIKELKPVVADWQTNICLVNCSYSFLAPALRLHSSSFCPALALLLPCSFPAPVLLLTCSCSAPVRFLPYFFSCPTPALLLVLPTPVWQPSSLSALYDFFRHGDSRLLWYHLST